ncbi:hypothetical protein GF362_02410 [Candidatus Dojkabacteria bacterium]|nr:hypothetical protein [Candidatus Dojkabacteria bacterium]
MDTFQIIYATGSGNTELVCEEVSKLFKINNIENVLHRAEITSIDVIKNNQMFIFGTSTWEHGEINPYFNHLLKKMRDIKLKGKKAGFIGLGDNRYEKFLFCEGIEILRRAFLENGGEQIGNTLKIQGEPHDQLETRVKQWVKRFIEEF